MNASAIECPAAHSNHESANSLIQNDSVIQGNITKYLLRALFTLLLFVIVGCSIDRNPVPLDSIDLMGLDGSAEQESEADNGTSIGESQRESGVTPSFDASRRDSSAQSEASTREASTRDASTEEASAREASIMDTSVGDESKADTALPPVDAEDPIECDLRGIYGGKVTVEAWWGGRTIGELVALVDPGRATLLLHIMYFVQSIESDGTIIATAKTCNIELPPFYTTLVCESYQPIFPTHVWDSAPNPSYTVTGKADCTEPGCTIHFDTIPALLGVSLDDPFDDWPDASETQTLSCAEGTGRDCFLDHDDDGEPGITVELLTEGIAPSSSGCLWSTTGGYVYNAPPISFDLGILFQGPVPRTDRIHLGTRAILGGDIVIDDDCQRAKGAGIAEGFQSRAISCYLQPGVPTGAGDGSLAGADTRCTGDQRQFMDENLPLYNCMKQGDVPPADLIAITDQSPSEGPQVSLVKLGEIGDGITCEDVRNAAY